MEETGNSINVVFTLTKYPVCVRESCNNSVFLRFLSNQTGFFFSWMDLLFFKCYLGFWASSFLLFFFFWIILLNSIKIRSYKIIWCWYVLIFQLINLVRCHFSITLWYIMHASLLLVGEIGRICIKTRNLYLGQEGILVQFRTDLTEQGKFK